MDASSRISPLRQRMIDDMRMRKLSDKTQGHYLRWVQRFAGYLEGARLTAPPSRICAAINCTWLTMARRRYRSMRRSPG
jgi:hypothetical protein